MIAVIDYGMGNIKSVVNALLYLGEDVAVTADPKKIGDASHIILPGVGAFGKAMSNLEKLGMVDILDDQVIKKGKPFLGICLGLQLLAKSSHEHGEHSGLGWIDGDVRKFNIDDAKLKLPHMGWNEIVPKTEHPVFGHLKDDQYTFYFVHNYHIECNDPGDIAATCSYGYEFPAVICRDNIIATQFHPEKSQDNGIQFLENFVEWEQ
ncbi:imidazole glycerol phosphate synthase subunit HisH [Candidatus Omnitrophota bacterium]